MTSICKAFKPTQEAKARWQPTSNGKNRQSQLAGATPARPDPGGCNWFVIMVES